MPFVAVALGSNLGDRRAHLTWAIDQLRSLLSNLRASGMIETAPFQVADEQPMYLNAVVVGDTGLDPEALLEHLMAFERERGRRRPSLRASRTLDLDIILFGDRVLDTPALVVPHPRFRERRFVLEPLAALAPEWVDPVTGKSMRELLAYVEKAG